MTADKERVTLLHGDCRELLKSLPDQSIDSIVTDPPYELGFMGKRWDASGIAYDIKVWQECLRVLKPGGHLLAFGGTRTYHRMTCAIEDAGFEIRDCIMWVYGSGFPKSHDVSKAIDKAAGAERKVVGPSRANIRADLKYGGNDPSHNHGRYGAVTHPPITAPTTEAAKQWQGWGSALKPAVEPIVVARKPLDGTIADNVLRHGTGGINIDGCRVGTKSTPRKDPRNGNLVNAHMEMRPWMQRRIENGEPLKGDFDGSLGRWPANLIHDGSEEVVGLFPSPHGAGHARAGSDNPRATIKKQWQGPKSSDTGTMHRFGDSGSAARFFYCAKTSPSERGDNSHPTVKPLALMRYLCRLVTPPSGTVLDPFAGSGSTMVAARQEGFGVVGCELEAAHIEIIKRRLQMPPEPEVEKAQEVREQKSKSMQLRLF